MTETISNKLLQHKLNQKMLLLKKINDFPSEGIICDTDFRVVYVSSFGYEKNVALHSDITELIEANTVYEVEKIYEEQEVIGYKYLPTKEKNLMTLLGIESQNPDYQKLMNQSLKYAKSSFPIHIFGESGSGKEVMKNFIHEHSSYQKGPLVSLNCGAFNEQLLESELFGYAPGAFTGALPNGYEGKITQANGGTLFLDGMPTKMQQALLRVLEDKMVTPIGGKEKQVDFRIITASNKKLSEQVNNRLFREDLFYRLVVCHISIPALRNRQEDLTLLLQDFFQRKNWQISWMDKLTQVIKSHQWPGNIREFHNFLERLYLLHQKDEPSLEELWELLLVGSIKKTVIKDQSIIEKERIENTLKEANFHLSQTAEILGISRTTLYRKMKKYEITI